jgi:hypothetical protein
MPKSEYPGVFKRIAMSALNLAAVVCFVYLAFGGEEIEARPFLLLALSSFFMGAVIWTPGVQAWLFPAVLLLVGIAWLWIGGAAGPLVKSAASLFVAVDLLLSFQWLGDGPEPERLP